MANIICEDGAVFEVNEADLSKSAKGGQGLVVKVKEKSTKKTYAAKIMHPVTNPAAIPIFLIQMGYILDLVNSGMPPRIKKQNEEGFIHWMWPLHFFKTELNGAPTYGYIMDYVDVARTVSANRIIFTNHTDDICDVKLLTEYSARLCEAFAAIHGDGYFYGDISPNNVLFEKGTGKIHIIDLDNVRPDGQPTVVLGTPFFIAPEVSRGAARPSINNDKWALSVLLFMMWTGGHPLIGEDPTRNDEDKLDHPVFVFDPNNSKNRPNKNSICNLRWSSHLPDSLKKRFERVFTADLENDTRTTSMIWANTFSKVSRDYMTCPKCKKICAGTADRCYSCDAKKNKVDPKSLPKPTPVVAGPHIDVIAGGKKIKVIELKHEKTSVRIMDIKPGSTDDYEIGKFCKEGNNWVFIKTGIFNISSSVGELTSMDVPVKITKGTTLNVKNYATDTTLQIDGI